MGIVAGAAPQAAIAVSCACAQGKLLHVLQDGEFSRLGSNKRVTADARVIAATNRDLESMLPRAEFREDLYYRLKVIEITVPPLRERTDEIHRLFEFFVRMYAKRYNRSEPTLSEPLREAMERYHWPGNIRELENTIERAAVMCTDGSIDLLSLPDRLLADRAALVPAPFAAAEPEDPSDLSIKRASRRAEEGLIRRALEETGGNRTKAAELLEISHRALLYKIKEYGIVVPRY
jgi:two-component system response regulator AtoC